MARAERVRFAVRSRWRTALKNVFALMPFGLVLWFLSVFGPYMSIALILAFAGIGASLSLVLHQRSANNLPAPGPFKKATVEVGEECVTINTEDGDITLRPNNVTRAFVQPRGSAAEVVIETKAGRCELSASSIPFGREILEAIGQAPWQKPITFKFSGGLHVTVGVDGVLVAWPILRRKRFIPHARIVRVDEQNSHVALELFDGTSYQIAVGAQKHQVELRKALIERLREARDAHNASVGSDAAVHLGRGGRSIEAWVREAKALMAGGGGQYRSAAPPPEVLWRIVADPSEDEEMRVGASLALRGVLDDEGRERLRVTAEAAVSPKVRVALTASAEEEDDEAVAAAIVGRRSA